MRPIKCRGKRKRDGVWVYGHFMEFGFDKTPLIYVNHRSIIPYGWHEVIPETVGQFTGLYDTEGNEIHDGDILRVYDYYDEDDPELNETVGFFEVINGIDDGYPAFTLKDSESITDDTNTLAFLDNSDEFYYIVASNIHDHKELIINQRLN